MSVADKMKLKRELPLLQVNTPSALKSIFDEFAVPKGDNEDFGQVLLFAIDKAALNDWIAKCLPSITNNTLLWIAYPKKSGSIKSDISRDEGWEILEKSGYTGVTQIAVDDDWSALRFRKASELKTHKRSIPIEERMAEGIDYKNKIVKLPKDIAAAMDEHSGLKEFFAQYSFSHKKEHIEYIVEAKRPETRARRVEKTIKTLLQERKNKKQNK